MNWTPDLDRALYSIANNGASRMAEVAAKFTEATGVPATEDMARNRLKRIRQDIALQDTMRSASPDDALFTVPAVPQDEYVNFRLTFWDLETTNLSAMMGRVLCCSFADEFGQVKTFRYEDYPGKSIIDDGPLCVAIRDELEKADIWVGWNSKLFDVPLLNARLMKAGERPLRSDVKHLDAMYYAGGQFNRVGSRKLDNVSKFVNSPNRKTPLDWTVWQLAMTGDRDAMDQVVEHCEADVLVTRDVFAVLKPSIRIVHR